MFYIINGNPINVSEDTLKFVPENSKEVSEKEYNKLLVEQNKKREEAIATRNAENAKKLEVLKESGLSDEAIQILKPELITEKFIVNITTENKKKKAVVHSTLDGVDYDEKRGDKIFNTREEAEKYVSELAYQK